MTNFSVVVPLFNEEQNIETLVNEIFLSLKNYNNFELILVDDASTDKTGYILNNLKNKNFKNIKIIKNKQNLGQSSALLEGIRFAENKIIVTIDGDGQNNPKDIPILLDKYVSDENLFLVGGIRKKRKDSYVKIISSKIANSIRSFVLDDDCTDTGCSLKVFDKEIFISFTFFDGIHRFMPALFKGCGKKTYFLNVDHRKRMHGYSKYGTFDRLFCGIRDLIKVAKIINKFKSNRV